MAQFEDIVVRLDGDEVVLRCTQAALSRLCAKYGNLRDVLLRIPGFDFNIMCDVVEVATLDEKGKPIAKRSEIERTVFEAGLFGLVQPLSEYITRLSNGGRPYSANDEDPEDVDPNAV